MRSILILGLMLTCLGVQAQACYDTTIMAPSPFMGNHGEVFRTADGAIYEVEHSYEYLYAYYPTVTICPGHGRMTIEDSVVGIRALKSTSRRPSPPLTTNRRGDNNQARPTATEAPIRVVLRMQGCDYFVADGPRGYYLLEWYGGYDPDSGDGIFGELNGYGFREILYDGGQEGKIYVDDYLLSKDSALEKLREECE